MVWDVLLIVYMMGFIGWSWAGLTDDRESHQAWPYLLLDAVVSALAVAGMFLFVQGWGHLVYPWWGVACAVILAGEATLLFNDFESRVGDTNPLGWIALTLLFLLPAIGVNLALALGR